MFYSSEILNIKSNPKLGVVWLAATLGPKSNARRLGRKDLTSISVPKTCSFLAAPPEPLSLRLSANLMIGISRVYGQQCQYHMVDVQGLCTKLTHLSTPANPESINLQAHEKKGTNITMKKIDCISAVNVLSGDPLNFPDLDIANLLKTESARTSLSSSNLQSTEIGRKSLLGTPFSVSSLTSSTNNNNSNNNTLQGSDFTTALGDSDFGEFNEEHHAGALDFQHYMRPNASDSLDDFQVPDVLARRRQSRSRKLKNSLMDHELMLEKDQLFISETEMLSDSISFVESSVNKNPNEEALELLNNSEELSMFHDLWNAQKFAFELPSKQTRKITKASAGNDRTFNNEMDLGDIEEFRGDNNLHEGSSDYGLSTPQQLLTLPWSTSSSASSRKQIISSILNTPSRKPSSSSPISALNDLKLLSSSSDTSYGSNYQEFPASSNNLSKETFDFYCFLQEAWQSSMSAKSRSITSFSTLLKKETTGKAVAARAFHHLLELKTSAMIEVSQNRPFSDIQIKMIL